MGGVFSRRRREPSNRNIELENIPYRSFEEGMRQPLTVAAEITELRSRIRELERKQELNKYETSNMIKGLVDLIEGAMTSGVGDSGDGTGTGTGTGTGMSPAALSLPKTPLTGTDSITMSRLLDDFKNLRDGR